MVSGWSDGFLFCYLIPLFDIDLNSQIFLFGMGVMEEREVGDSSSRGQGADPPNFQGSSAILPRPPNNKIVNCVVSRVLMSLPSSIQADMGFARSRL